LLWKLSPYNHPTLLEFHNMRKSYKLKLYLLGPMSSTKKVKPPKQTLEDLLKSNQVVTGKVIVERKKVMDEAIEFEMRERRYKANTPK